MTLLDLIQDHNLEGQNYEYVASFLNEKPLVSNTALIQQVPNPYKMSDFLGIIQQSQTAEADLAIVTQIANLVGVGESIGNHLSVSSEGNIEGFLVLLEGSGVASSNISAIRARAEDTIDDPDYQTQVRGMSLAESAGLGVITAEQIQGVVA